MHGAVAPDEPARTLRRSFVTAPYCRVDEDWRQHKKVGAAHSAAPCWLISLVSAGGLQPEDAASTGGTATDRTLRAAGADAAAAAAAVAEAAAGNLPRLV